MEIDLTIVKKFMALKTAAKCLTHDEIDNQTIALLLVANRLNELLACKPDPCGRTHEWK
jgi:hypothetical protein